MKKMRLIVNILTLLLLAIGTLAIVSYCNKIVTTSLDMLVYRDNALFYIEQNKDDSEEFVQNQEIRTEKFYESSDDVVRFFSNQNFLVKTLIFLVALLMYPLIGVVWLRELNKCRVLLYRKLRRWKRKRRLQKREV